MGSLNHAILTAEAIARDGLVLAGWVANTGAEKMPCYEENLASLAGMISAPLLGILPWCENEIDSELVFDELLLKL